MWTLLLLLSTALAVSARNGQESEGEAELFEDEIILTKAQKTALEKGHGGDFRVRGDNKWGQLVDKWPRNTVKYYMDPIFSDKQKELIRSTVQNLERKLDSCIKFRESRAGHHVRVVNGTGCGSLVGRGSPWYAPYTGYQALSLGQGCLNEPTIEHEFLHAVGLWHHHNRKDRNKYVEILYDNILKGKLRQFKRQDFYDETYHFNLPYDFESIMHYRPTAFSSNRRLTIRTLDPTKQGLIGRSRGASEGDIKQVKMMYGCMMNPSSIGASTCNFTDKSENCKKHKGICNHWVHKEHMEFACAKTCLCDQ